MMKANPFHPGFMVPALDFGKVMEGREVTAEDSHLLNLPVEILSMIIHYLDGDNETLAALALVNADCRQLSRSCQFRSIVLDYRCDRAAAFLQTLRQDKEQRDRTGQTDGPSLTACIRRLAILTKDPNVGHDVSGYICHLTSKALRVHEYHLVVISLLDNMPNLDIIEFSGCRFVLQSLLKGIRNTRVRSLKWSTEACCMGQDLGAEKPCIALCLEPLQPLTHLDIAIDSGIASTKYVKGQDLVITNLFDHCASTLQSLRVSHNFPTARLSLAVDFPQLRSLHIVNGSLLDRKTACSLFQSKKLSSLAVDFSDIVLQECLVEASAHLTLEVLALYRLDEVPGPALLQLLKKSPAIKAVYLGGELSPEFNVQLIPILAGLQNLRQLSITWTGSEITTSSLASISELKSLEQLHISTGLQRGTWYSWFVDHDTILFRLRPLQNLQRIILTRDSYTFDKGASMLSAGGYYAHRLPNRGQWLRAIRNGVTFQTVQGIWEGQHRYRMMGYAQKYAEVFKQLESIHVGQLTFEAHGGATIRTAVLNNPQRCEGLSIPEIMFGIH